MWAGRQRGLCSSPNVRHRLPLPWGWPGGRRDWPCQGAQLLSLGCNCVSDVWNLHLRIITASFFSSHSPYGRRSRVTHGKVRAHLGAPAVGKAASRRGVSKQRRPHAVRHSHRHGMLRSVAARARRTADVVAVQHPACTQAVFPSCRKQGEAMTERRAGRG